MTFGKVLVTVLIVSAMAMAMALLENVGGREMTLKVATAKAYPHVLSENYEGYKPKEDYECDGYKYKDKDCYEYGNCDKSPYNEDDDSQYDWSSKETNAKAEKNGRKVWSTPEFPLKGSAAKPTP